MSGKYNSHKKDLIQCFPEDIEKYLFFFDVEFLDLKNFFNDELLNIGNSFLSLLLKISYVK